MFSPFRHSRCSQFFFEGEFAFGAPSGLLYPFVYISPLFPRLENTVFVFLVHVNLRDATQISSEDEFRPYQTLPRANHRHIGKFFGVRLHSGPIWNIAATIRLVGSVLETRLHLTLGRHIQDTAPGKVNVKFTVHPSLVSQDVGYATALLASRNVSFAINSRYPAGAAESCSTRHLGR